MRYAREVRNLHLEWILIQCFVPLLHRKMTSLLWVCVFALTLAIVATDRSRERRFLLEAQSGATYMRHSTKGHFPFYWRIGDKFSLADKDTILARLFTVVKALQSMVLAKSVLATTTIGFRQISIRLPSLDHLDEWKSVAAKLTQLRDATGIMLKLTAHDMNDFQAALTDNTTSKPDQASLLDTLLTNTGISIARVEALLPPTWDALKKLYDTKSDEIQIFDDEVIVLFGAFTKIRDQTRIMKSTLQDLINVAGIYL
ncbi:hypothetical protein ElyMa_002694900 [Elysia marginata]|uniref:Uncharacterized protein n=1 Tax=Elysia marginata TaxID=1093978 RepID=A0AAV4HDG1_9GAST|nr:hypothetical protein ElyMa_002694900 [Elysia marginata]